MANNLASLTNEMTIANFNYQRLDLKRLAALAQHLPKELKSVSSAQAKYELLREYDEKYRTYVENISYLLFQSNVSLEPSYYKSELDYYISQLASWKQTLLSAKFSVLQGNLSELAQLTGKRYLIDLQMQYFLEQSSTLKINEQQQEVAKTIQAEVVHLSSQTAKPNWHEKGKLNASLNKLLELGARKAKLLGYDNYGELAMAIAAKFELDVGRLREIRQSIQKYLLPLYKGLLPKANLYQNGWLTFANKEALLEAFKTLLSQAFPKSDFAYLNELQTHGYFQLAANSNLQNRRDFANLQANFALSDLYLAKQRQTLICWQRYAHITDWTELYQNIVSASFSRLNRSANSLLENELPDFSFKVYASQVLESLCFQTSEKLYGNSYFYRRVMQILEKLLHICLLTELQEQLYLVNPQMSADLLSLSRDLYSSLHDKYFSGLKRYANFLLPCNFKELLAESFAKQLNVLLELSGLMLWDQSAAFQDPEARSLAFQNLLKLGRDHTAVEAIRYLEWPSAFDEDAIKHLAYKLAYHLETNRTN